MAFVLASSALPFLVLAHDSANADYHDLAHHYAERSPARILSGQRWFYCAGLGIALFLMGVITLTHVHRTIPGQRISKKHRIAFRSIIAVVLVMLGFADELNSLHLMAVTTSLVVLVLLVDLFGATNVKHNIIWGGDGYSSYGGDTTSGATSSSNSIHESTSGDEEKLDNEKGGRVKAATKEKGHKPHKRHRPVYTAKCKMLKKDLAAMLKAGEKVNVRDVAKKGGDAGYYHH